MKRTRSRIEKAAPDGDKDQIFRLTDIDPEFVSLVRAGANRQKSFMVVKEDEAAADPIPDDFDEAQMNAFLGKLTGSPRNRFGTHSSYKFKGDYAEAWKLHFSQHAEGKPDATSTGPIRGAARRVEMIASKMKPVHKLPSTDNIGARIGDPSPLVGTYAATAKDYDIEKWDELKDDETRESVKLSCSDLEVIKRAALAEVKRRAEDAKKEGEAAGKGGANDTEGEGRNGGGEKSGATGTPPKDAVDLASWLEEAGEHVEELSLDIAIQAALDSQLADGTAPGTSSKRVQEIECTLAPGVTTKAGGEVSKEAQRVAELEAELSRSRKENTALRAKVTRAAATVGKSSVILTGEVTSRQQRPGTKKESPARGVFHHGGDVAAAVAQLPRDRR